MIRQHLPTIIAVVTAAILLWLVPNFDPDAGKYKPEWRNKAQYPKAAIHFLIAFGGMLAMLVVGVPLMWAVIIAAAFIPLYEVRQGFFNPLDVIAGAVGAGIALLLFLL